ncbi:MAG: hypothetical protein AABY22_11505 [Nanoarchaeota archaeon]
MEKKTRIIFNDKSIDFVLEALGYKTDSLGSVTDMGGYYVMDVDGRPFFKNDIIGIIGNNWITRESQLYMLVNEKNK